MANTTQSGDKKKLDARPDTIGHIWWATLAMLAVCIPLCAVLKSASLPLIVIGAAVLATMFIWKSPQKGAPSEDEVETLRAKIRELEERLGNVEVINTFDEKLAEKSLRREQRVSELAELQERD